MSAKRKMKKVGRRQNIQLSVSNVLLSPYNLQILSVDIDRQLQLTLIFRFNYLVIFRLA